MVRVVRGAVAEHLGVDRRAARARGLELLEHEDARPLPHDEARTRRVERPRGERRVLLLGDEPAHRAEPGEDERRDRRLGAAGEDDVGLAAPDRRRRLADRGRAGRARGDGREVLSLEAELDRDLPARRVDEHRGDEERRDAVRRRARRRPAAARRSSRSRRSPTRRGSRPASGSTPSSPASSQASCAAATARRTLRSIRRASFGGTSSPGSKPRTSAAIRTGYSEASNASIHPTPLRPDTAESQVDGASSPIGVTAPRPVMTTRAHRIAAERLAASGRTPATVSTRWHVARRSRSSEPVERPADLDAADSLPADGGGARPRAARGRRVAVRAEVGRLPGPARERVRRAAPVVAERAAAAPLLPRARAARRAAPAALVPRRRDRDRARRRARLRRDADEAPPRREPRAQALGGDPRDASSPSTCSSGTAWSTGGAPLAERRSTLEELARGFVLSPCTARPRRGARVARRRSRRSVSTA